jgi:hypothetical protein
MPRWLAVVGQGFICVTSYRVHGFFIRLHGILPPTGQEGKSYGGSLA